MATVLYSKRDRGTSTHIEAKIDYDGNLVISGNDTGELPRKIWGDDDYEYWLTIRCKNKEKVLEALIEHCNQVGISMPSLPQNKDEALLTILKQVYGGHLSAFEEFHDFLKAKMIPAKFDSYV